MINSAIQILAIGFSFFYPIYSLIRSERMLSAASLLVLLWLVSALGVCDFLLPEFPDKVALLSSISLYCMALLCPVSILFSNVFCRDFIFTKLPKAQHLLLALSLMPLFLVGFFPVSSFFFSPDFATDKMLFLEPIAFFFYLQLVLFLAVSLFNLEATVANAPHGVRWKIKFAMVGIGVILATHVLYFSQGIIFRAIDIGFVSPRALGVVIGLLLMVYSKVSRGGDERIVISRHLAYRSFVVLFCALFLLAVGLIGEGVKIFGSEFNSYAFIMLVLVAGIALVVVALSESVRRKVKLTIQKHFYGEKYDYRIEWKKFTDRMTHARSKEELYDNILTVYCETFGIVGGCMYLQGRHSSDFAPVSFHEMDESKQLLPDNSTLIRAVRDKKNILDLRQEELELDEEVKLFLQKREARFIVPIHSAPSMVGFIILGAPINIVEQYDDEDLELMEAISSQAAAVLMNLRLGDELAEARDMEAFGKVAAFVLHDLKNQVYPLSLLAENAREYINEPEFQKDMLASLSNIVSRMNILISQLTNIPTKGSLRLEVVDLMEVAREAAELIPSAKIEFVGGPTKAWVDVEEIKKVALNLYLNAMGTCI